MGPAPRKRRIDRPSDEGSPEPSQRETPRQSELYAKPPPGPAPSALHPPQIALLLPFRGGYRKAAEAVRDGFIAAWHSAGDYKPALKIYDANALNVEQIYAQAVAEGADFVVGPLEKQAIEELAKLTDLPVPVLALNQAPAGRGEKPAGSHGVLPNLMQFGLSPEGEAPASGAKGPVGRARQGLGHRPQRSLGATVASGLSRRLVALGRDGVGTGQLRPPKQGLLPAG